MNKLFLRFIAAFGLAMMFAVSGWGVVLDTDTFNTDKDGWGGSGESWDAGQRLFINRDQTGTKTFTFAGYPNQVVTVTLDATKTATWEAADLIYITANGTEVYNLNTGGSISFNATLNGSGQLALIVTPNTNNDNEDLYIDNISITYIPPPEINVVGVADGGTDVSFGSALVTGGTIDKTYTIENTGTGDLTLGAVSASGDFTVTSQPTSPVTTGHSTTFTVRFNPTAVGTRTATVTFSNNDSNENPYNFSISGIGDAPPVMGDVPNQVVTVGTAYSLNIAPYVTLTNSDSISVYTLTGTLPTGLSFNTSTGVISGTPTAAAAAVTLSVTATDNDGISNSDSFTITVNALSFASDNWRLFSSVNYSGDHNMKGDITTIGNSVMVPDAGGCAATTTSNNFIPVTYADIDSNATTFNSTSAELRLPASATDKEIVWAGLYWQGYRVNRSDADKTLAKQVLFKTPTSSNYVSLTSEPSKFNWLYVSHATYDRFYFQGATDVTDLVKAGGEGYYTVANVQSDTLSAYTADLNTLGGAFGAWSIVVIYKDSSTTLKNISVYDGYVSLGTVGATVDGPVFSSYDIPLGGFLTPTGGSVNSNFLVFAGEGDAANASDSAKLRNNSGTFVDITNSVNPSNNIFNSKVSDFGALVTNRNPNCENTVGVDIDKFAVGSNAGAGTQGQVIQNGQTDTIVRLASGGDGYYPGVFAFATDIYQPFITIIKSTDTSGTLTPQQVIKYTANITNSGNENASNIRIFDNFDDNNLSRIDGTPTDPVVTLGDLLDDNTTSISNSIVCNYGPAHTDCKSTCTVTSSPFEVACMIPFMAIGESAFMEFQTKIASNPDTKGQDVKVENRMYASYYNAITGASVDQSSSNLTDAGVYYAPVASLFDAWETTLTRLAPKLYTQIASKNFTFNIGTVDGTAFNGAVCASVINAGGTILSGGGYQCFDSTTASTPFSWMVAQAERIAKIQIKAKNGVLASSVNLATPVWTGFSDSNSTDSFAIRPDHFVFSAPMANMKSGEDYNLNVNAYDFSGANALGYDQIVSNLTGAPALWWNRDTGAQIMTVNNQGTITIAGGGSFTNGVGSVPIRFNDVGQFTLDLNDTTWAAVDSGDGIAADVYTIQGEGDVTFIPWDFNISVGTIVNNGGPSSSFTYLSRDLNMSARIPMTIRAQNKQGAITQNYANNMYERSITITPYVSSVAATARGLIPLTLGATNADGNFTSGTATILYNDPLVARFNFDRNQTIAVSPFDVNSSNGVGNDVNVTVSDSDSVYGDKNQTLSAKATFVYGRFIPRDVRVFGNVPFTANGWYEVYNTPSINGTALAPSKNGSGWYTNRLHNDVNAGDANITSILAATSTVLPISSVSNGTGIESYGFVAEIVPYSAKAHIDIAPWLWYGPTVSSYAHPGADCSTHPCFNISVVPPIGASGSAKTEVESTKGNKSSSGSATGWKSTSDYAPAIQ